MPIAGKSKFDLMSEFDAHLDLVQDADKINDETRQMALTLFNTLTGLDITEDTVKPNSISREYAPGSANFNNWLPNHVSLQNDSFLSEDENASEEEAIQFHFSQYLQLKQKRQETEEATLLAFQTGYKTKTGEALKAVHKKCSPKMSLFGPTKKQMIFDRFWKDVDIALFRTRKTMDERIKSSKSTRTKKRRKAIANLVSIYHILFDYFNSDWGMAKWVIVKDGARWYPQPQQDNPVQAQSFLDYTQNILARIQPEDKSGSPVTINMALAAIDEMLQEGDTDAAAENQHRSRLLGYQLLLKQQIKNSSSQLKGEVNLDARILLEMWKTFRRFAPPYRRQENILVPFLALLKKEINYLIAYDVENRKPGGGRDTDYPVNDLVRRLLCVRKNDAARTVPEEKLWDGNVFSGRDVPCMFGPGSVSEWRERRFIELVLEKRANGHANEDSFLSQNEVALLFLIAGVESDGTKVRGAGVNLLDRHKNTIGHHKQQIFNGYRQR